MTYFTVIFARKRTCIETRTPKNLDMLKMQRKAIPFFHICKCFIKFQKLLGAYVYVIMST